MDGLHWHVHLEIVSSISGCRTFITTCIAACPNLLFEPSDTIAFYILVVERRYTFNYARELFGLQYRYRKRHEHASLCYI